MTISAVVMVLQVVLISRVWSQTPSPALASVSDRNLHDLIIFEGVVGMTAIHIPFSIDLSQFFAYLIVNNSRVDATVTAGSGDSNISIQLPDRHGVKDFLSTHPDYDSIVRKACKTGICEFRLSLAVTSDPAPLQILVQAMQGTNLSPGVDVHGRIEKPGQFRMYGLSLDQSMLPALLTMLPTSSDDLDVTIYNIDNNLPGLFDQKFPGPSQQNVRSNGPERILVQNLPNTFLRIDVLLHSQNAADYLVRINSNYNALDLYQLSIAGTIGAACLLGMCILVSVCIILARRSGQHAAALLEMAGAPIANGLSQADIDAGTERKKAAELSLSVDDAMCIVCLDEYGATDDLRVLPCGHHFHTDCIGVWFQEHKQCPLCNRGLCQPSSSPVPAPEPIFSAV